ncbi:hypothetical protein ACIP98_20850 [Streptomyces sp. NPDC088354]|uniref:DUF7620 family protein n=1 Tax=Streptomyces sp. NPDC088354 TaxID=3365856 RepID=UPI003805004B
MLRWTRRRRRPDPAEEAREPSPELQEATRALERAKEACKEVGQLGREAAQLGAELRRQRETNHFAARIRAALEEGR